MTEQVDLSLSQEEAAIVSAALYSFSHFCTGEAKKKTVEMYTHIEAVLKARLDKEKLNALHTAATEGTLGRTDENPAPGDPTGSIAGRPSVHRDEGSDGADAQDGSELRGEGDAHGDNAASDAGSVAASGSSVRGPEAEGER